MMRDHAKGLWITLFGVLFVIPDSYFIRVIDAPIFVIFFWRSFLQGVVVLLVLLMLQGRKKIYENARSTGMIGIGYAVALALSSLCFVASVKFTNVANTVFIISTIPVFAALSSWVWLREAVGLRLFLTMFVAVGGVVIIGLGSLSEAGHGSLFGDLLALGAALSFGVGITMARSVAPRNITPMVPIAYLAAALIVFPFVNPYAIAPDQWHLVFLHGGVFVAVSSTLLALGPRYISSAEVGILILLESAIAPLLVWVLVGEEPGGYALIGGGLIIGALLASNLIALYRMRAAEKTR